MNTKQFWSGLAGLAAAGLCVAAATVAVPAQEIAAPPGGDATADEQGYEALTRGPLHEAFANPYATSPEPGMIVEERPPEPIEEVPPEQMPEGDNVTWIPGYWGWDPDSEEFVWISGLWRNVPADRRWVPGYWAEADGGWQWVAGFWASAETEQLAYLPEPPPSLERGPNIGPPDGDYFWIPGCWVWQDVSYDWRPGYWAPAVADWVWIPDQYVWTPYGCVFVAGYWDYTFVDRGVMFAPVAFQQVVYTQPGFRYTPTVVIDSAPLMMHLFVSPTYSHYFYGDYYAFRPTRPQFAFQPWVAYDRRPNLYDPLLTYYQWSYGQRDVNIVQRLTVWNQYFVRNEAYRPPRTFRQQRQFLARANEADLPIQATSLAFASPLREFSETHADRVRFARVDEPARERISEGARALRQFQSQRSEFEVSAAAQSPPAERTEPGQTPATQPRPEQTLALPEAPAATPVARPDAIPGQDAAPGANAPGQDAGQATRPEPPAPPQPGQTPQADGETRPDDRPGADRPRGEDRPGRPQAGDEPTADAPAADEPATDDPAAGERRTRGDRPERSGRTGEDPGRPATDDQPVADDPAATDADQPRRGRRPGDAPATPPGETPDAAETPAADDTPSDATGPTLPEGGADQPGNRPGSDAAAPGLRNRPGREGGSLGRPGANAPGLDRPGATPPGNDAAGTEEGPRFPRFGTGRNRGPAAGSGDDPATAPPGTSNDPTSRPGLGRHAGRGGFDPFGGLPPGADGGNSAPDANDGLPRPGRRPGLGGALTPDATDPAQSAPPSERRPRGRGRQAPPDGGQGPAGGLVPGLPGGGPPAVDRPRRGRGGGGNAGGPGPGALPGVQPSAPGGGPGGPPQAGPGGPPATPPAGEGGGGGGRGRNRDREGDGGPPG